MEDWVDQEQASDDSRSTGGLSSTPLKTQTRQITENKTDTHTTYQLSGLSLRVPGSRCLQKLCLLWTRKLKPGTIKWDKHTKLKSLKTCNDTAMNIYIRKLWIYEMKVHVTDSLVHLVFSYHFDLEFSSNSVQLQSSNTAGLPSDTLDPEQWTHKADLPIWQCRENLGEIIAAELHYWIFLPILQLTMPVRHDYTAFLQSKEQFLSL